MEEIANFSILTDRYAYPFSKWQENGRIAFSDQYGKVYLTPYRTEIPHILQAEGYRDECISIPSLSNSQQEYAYQWLTKIADQQNWSMTYQKAFQIASKKGIKNVKVTGKYHVKEIVSCYEDREEHLLYSPLTTQFLLDSSEENIATYILIDEKTLMVCDEYGRTFLLKAKNVVNELVNELIDAGYTHTIHPERYIRPYEPDVEAE